MLRGLIWVIVRLVGGGFIVASAGVMAMAIAGVLGFAHPMLDVFNHFQTPIIVTSLALLVLTPLFVRLPRWRALATTLAATGFLASAVIVTPDVILRFLPRADLPDDGRTVYTMMTHNLFGRNYDAARVLAAIDTEDPDILTFQEYFPEQRNGLHDRLSVTYPYSSTCTGGKRQNIAIYAQIPFEAETFGACAPGDTGRTSRILARFPGRDGSAFAVMTTHLDWPLQISTFDDGANVFEGVDLMFARQRGQFADLSEALSTLPGPLLISADFNSTSWSYTLRDFASGNHLARQTFALLTYPAKFFIFDWMDTQPVAPLDHVMTRGGVDVHAVRAGDAAGSDHRPIILAFSIGR